MLISCYSWLKSTSGCISSMDPVTVVVSSLIVVYLVYCVDLLRDSGVESVDSEKA